MTTEQKSNQAKLTYEERLSVDIQTILADGGIDASTHPDEYAQLVRGLQDYVRAETRRSFVNGRKAAGQPQTAARRGRFDIQGKPSAKRAGKL